MKYLVSYKNYTLRRKIGTGCYGEVWEAREISSGRLVAVKKLYKLSTSHSRQRYINEVFALSKSNNPFLLELIGFTNTKNSKISFE